MIKEHLTEVKERIEQACIRSGRNPGEVTLIAVSKTKPVPMLEEAYAAGARDFGEIRYRKSRPRSRNFLRIYAGI